MTEAVVMIAYVTGKYFTPMILNFAQFGFVKLVPNTSERWRIQKKRAVFKLSCAYLQLLDLL